MLSVFSLIILVLADLTHESAVFGFEHAFLGTQGGVLLLQLVDLGVSVLQSGL